MKLKKGRKYKLLLQKKKKKRRSSKRKRSHRPQSKKQLQKKPRKVERCRRDLCRTSIPRGCVNIQENREKEEGRAVRKKGERQRKLITHICNAVSNFIALRCQFEYLKSSIFFPYRYFFFLTHCQKVVAIALIPFIWFIRGMLSQKFRFQIFLQIC